MQDVNVGDLIKWSGCYYLHATGHTTDVPILKMIMNLQEKIGIVISSSDKSIVVVDGLQTFEIVKEFFGTTETAVIKIESRQNLS